MTLDDIARTLDEAALLLTSASLRAHYAPVVGDPRIYADMAVDVQAAANALRAMIARAASETPFAEDPPDREPDGPTCDCGSCDHLLDVDAALEARDCDDVPDVDPANDMPCAGPLPTIFALDERAALEHDAHKGDE